MERPLAFRDDDNVTLGARLLETVYSDRRPNVRFGVISVALNVRCECRLFLRSLPICVLGQRTKGVTNCVSVKGGSGRSYFEMRTSA
jgi:hypothetical protein